MAGIRADICFGKRCRRLFGVDTLYFNYCSAPFNFWRESSRGPPGALWPIWYCASFRDKEIPKSSI